MNSGKTVLWVCFFILCFGAFIFWLYSYQKKSQAEFEILLNNSRLDFANNSQTNSATGGANNSSGSGPASGISTTTTSRTVTNIKNLRINSAQLKNISSKTFIVAFFGDQGITNDSHEVLKLLKREEADALVVLGDYDYEDKPKEWMKMLDTELGSNFPIIPVIGNHDEKEWAGYTKELETHLKRTPSITCEGILAVKEVCIFKNMRIFSTAPGIESIPTKSSEYADFIRTSANALASSTRNSIDKTWNICAWHKNQRLMQLGGKADETGWDTYNTCLDLGFPIFTAHEHSYSRSFLMSDLDSPVLVDKKFMVLATSSMTSATSTIITANSVDHLSVSPGKTFVLVSGLGGRSIRPQDLDNPWWSSAYSSTQKAKPGALFCAFNYLGNERQALCYFKNTEGDLIDVFVVER